MFNAPEVAREILSWNSDDVSGDVVGYVYSLSWGDLVDAMPHLPSNDGIREVMDVMRRHVMDAISESIGRECKDMFVGLSEDDAA